MNKHMTSRILVLAAMLTFAQPVYIQASEQIFEVGLTSEGPVILVDDENSLVMITGVEEDDIWGYTWNVAIENRSEKELMYSMNSVSVNGYMCDPYWAYEVPAGKRAHASVNWYSSELGASGITKIEMIEGTFIVRDGENYEIEPYAESAFAVKP